MIKRLCKMALLVVMMVVVAGSLVACGNVKSTRQGTVTADQVYVTVIEVNPDEGLYPAY